MSCNSLALPSLVECIREEVSRPCLLPNCLSCMVSLFLAVLIFVRFADEFGASGNIETKEQGKKQNTVTIMLSRMLFSVE